MEALRSNGLATAIVTNGHPEIQARAPDPPRDSRVWSAVLSIKSEL